MSGLIVVGGLEASSASDLLGSTLLASIPKNGILLFEMQMDINDATNAGAVSIQLPDNSQPVNALVVPAGNTSALAGVIDERCALKMRFRITQGGTCIFAYVETGTSLFSWRVGFKPI